MNGRLAWLGGLLMVAGAVGAQQPVVLANGCELTTVTVAGASDLVLVALWPTGLRDDPDGASGVAAAVLRWRLLVLHAVWPESGLPPCGCEIRPDHGLIWLQVPVGKLDVAARSLAAAVQPPVDAATEDRAMVAIGQAALAADDAEFTIPGLRLQSLARQRLLTGAAALPLAGRAREVQTCTEIGRAHV